MATTAYGTPTNDRAPRMVTYWVVAAVILAAVIAIWAVGTDRNNETGINGQTSTTRSSTQRTMDDSTTGTSSTGSGMTGTGTTGTGTTGTGTTGTGTTGTSNQ